MYYANMFYSKAQSAVGVVAERVLVYPYEICPVVTCRDRTSRTFSTGDSVDEGEGNAFNATDSSMIAGHVELKMAPRSPMFGESSQGHFTGNAWI